jgi:hypothetical protein
MMAIAQASNTRLTYTDQEISRRNGGSAFRIALP